MTPPSKIYTFAQNDKKLSWMKTPVLEKNVARGLKHRRAWCRYKHNLDRMLKGSIK